MQKICTADIEAVNWIEFACLGFYDGEEYQVFWGLEHFLEHFLSRKYKGFKCYFHFGGRYDFRFFIPSLIESGKYDIKFLERGSKIMSIKVKCRRSKSTWTFTDSYFLLPASLDELSKSFDIHYKKVKFNVEDCKKPSDFNTPEAQTYLKHDVIGLYEILEKFSSWGMNGGEVKQTLPSQSLHIFKSKFLSRDLFSLNESQEEFIRKTYFGGRVEIFKTYGKNLNYYDYNSLYPSVMLEEMPVGRPMYVRSFYNDLIGFYRVTLKENNKEIPVLPAVIGGKLFFPSGEGEFFTTTAELKLLKKIGIKFAVKEGIVFDQKEAIFKDYIKYMWDLRTQYPKGTMLNLLAKLCSNSLYGKFGQKRKNEELVLLESPPIGGRVFDEYYGLYLVEKTSRSLFILPYLASYITSLARVRLYEAFLQSGLENVYYCDTDSIITSSELKTGDGLGDLKLEYKIKEAVFLQPKAYSFILQDGTEISKVKGMKNLKLPFSTFKKALFENKINLIESRYDDIVGFRQSLRENGNFLMKRRTFIKSLNFNYNKRKIIGLESKPFEYDYLIKLFDK